VLLPHTHAYLWDLTPAYRNEWTDGCSLEAAYHDAAGKFTLRLDLRRQIGDDFIANSEKVRRRIQKNLSQGLSEVPPPGQWKTFYW